MYCSASSASKWRPSLPITTASSSSWSSSSVRCSGYTIGSSGPMIESTFWKKTIQGAILCDHPTRFDSSSCSRKFPAVWKNFFGTIGARSFTSASACSATVREASSRSKYARIDATSSSATVSSSTRPTFPPSKVTSFTSRHPAYLGRGECVDLRGVHERGDLEVFAFGAGESARGAVVDRRDSVATEHRGVGEPPDDVALGRGTEHRLVTLVERPDQLVFLRDLGPGRRDVDLRLDAVVREAIAQPARELAQCRGRLRHRHGRRHAHVEEEVGPSGCPARSPGEAAVDRTEVDHAGPAAVRRLLHPSGNPLQDG